MTLLSLPAKYPAYTSLPLQNPTPSLLLLHAHLHALFPQQAPRITLSLHLQNTILKQTTLHEIATFLDIPLKREIPHPQLQGVKTYTENSDAKIVKEIYAQVMEITKGDLKKKIETATQDAKGDVKVFIEKLAEAVPRIEKATINNFAEAIHYNEFIDTKFSNIEDLSPTITSETEQKLTQYGITATISAKKTGDRHLSSETIEEIHTKLGVPIRDMRAFIRWAESLQEI